MRDLNTYESAVVSGGQQDSSNPPPGDPNNIPEAISHGVKTFAATNNLARGIAAGFWRAVT